MPSMSTEYNKAYYEKNKEHIKEKLYEKILCPVCYIWTARGNKSKHDKTAKHIKNMEKSKNKENENENKYKIIVICDIKDINKIGEMNKIGEINKIVYMNKIDDLNKIIEVRE